MIRVLQCVNNMHRAGLETMLMNYYRRIDREQIQFDFLTHRPERADYDDEIESLGGKVYYAPRLYPQNLPEYNRYMRQFFKEHPEYKIMHSHIDPMSYLPLKAGKKAGVPIRIAHSHNTSIDKDMKYWLKMYYRERITSVATDFLACGEEAGQFLFKGKPFEVVPNAIEKDPFLFNEDVRTKKRQELGLGDELVIGHIGRISYQKNHRLLVQIFSNIVKLNPNSKLLIIGVGEKEEEIRKLVNDLGITDKVLFLGKRTDVNELYQAMDAFVMPSFFEGVPVVGVEAQFAKLPCFFSDKVPVEVSFSEATSFIKLEEDPAVWAKTILDKMASFKDRRNIQLTDNRYDINESYIVLEDMYKQFYSRL
ncbi:glycosyltransferase family 1 protein [Pseudobutyrivibrio xylanivorans]|uniref:Glycosyltransferase involved in cell wall bisynthesis n=1 Tax=Pseudobutyrivibrio xylanivorans DSM 14809 TaxID=1123012 RepID=A0A1M6I301_PSEXY|nr:glycosyltransferase family 1 protein [Pseudobutyrivibrio xylanivorans]SHJ28674.1 Glycosyltransferase involved in cell wall bisynthesis [Pseudobutyrivibrio xylanivorans DSM 14809]